MATVFCNKKYEFTLNNVKFILTLKSILRDNCELLHIKLTRILINSISHFYYEKSLKEIYKEYKELTGLSSINLIINYLSDIIKSNKIKLSYQDNSTFIIMFKDTVRNNKIIFTLKSKEDNNVKNVEESGNGNNNMRNVINTQNRIQSGNSQLENKNVINNNGNNSIKKSSLKKEEEINLNIKNKMEKNENNNKSKVYNNLGQLDNNNQENYNYEISGSVSIYNSYSYNVENSNNQSIENQSNNNIYNNYNRNKENNIKKSYIHKENNCEILFKMNPELINNKKYVMDINSNEECEFFTAFNIAGGQQPIIVWTTKNDNKTINLVN